MLDHQLDATHFKNDTCCSILFVYDHIIESALLCIIRDL